MNDECPICGASIEVQCKCLVSDKICVNGHTTHFCLLHKKIVSGASNHGKPTHDCHCEDYADNIILGDYK